MTTLYAVRTNFEDISGGLDHEALYGCDPTVFRGRPQADDHATELNRTAKRIDWSDDRKPLYWVEETTEADMWPAESIADDCANIDVFDAELDCDAVPTDDLIGGDV